MLATFLLLASLAASPETDPLQAAHARGEATHTLEVMRVESAIESLNDGLVRVFGVRREYRCPGGELVAEAACDPCTIAASDWAERPAGAWFYETTWQEGSASEQRAALARVDHFSRYFLLERRTGADGGGRRRLLLEYGGKLNRPPPAPRAMRVRFFSGGKETSAARVPAGSAQVELEVRAQKMGEDGALVDFAEANLSYRSACGTARTEAPGRVRFALAPLVERCDLEVLAAPGDARAVVGVWREARVEILYEGQAPDELVLDGAEFVDLRARGSAAGAVMAIAPEWSATGATIEKRPDGVVRVRLERGAARGEVRVSDGASGAGDRLLVIRKPVP